VATLGLGGHGALVASFRVDGVGLLIDDTVLDELADAGTTVSLGNIGSLGRVKPNLSLTALEDRSRKALLLSKKSLVINKWIYMRNM
jgi:hypothetical protein